MRSLEELCMCRERGDDACRGPVDHTACSVVALRGIGVFRSQNMSVLIVYAYISVCGFSSQEKRTSAARRYRPGKIFKKPDRCTVGHALDAVDGSAA